MTTPASAAPAPAPAPAKPSLEQLVAKAYDTVKDDVVTAVKSHPQYAQLVEALAAKAVGDLISLVA